MPSIITAVSRLARKRDGGWRADRGPTRSTPEEDPHMRTLIVEDQGMFRDMLIKLCRLQLGHTEVRGAGDAAEAIRLLKQEPFDLLIVDIVLPDGDGFEVAEEAAALPAPPRIIGMSGCWDPVMVNCIGSSKLDGCMDKSCGSVDALADAIRTVCSGRMFVSDSVRTLVKQIHENPAAFSKLLSAREREFLPLLARGWSDAEVGGAVGTSRAAAHWHRSRIMHKLGLHSVGELIWYAFTMGFVRIGPRPPIPARSSRGGKPPSLNAA
jgi:two-component system, NarL family, response regulator NreC